MDHTISRRGFMTAAAGAVVATRATGGSSAPAVFAAGADKPALLGGKPGPRQPFPSWPVVDEREEKALLRRPAQRPVVSRRRQSRVDRFEEAYAQAHRRQALPRHRQRHQPPSTPRWARWISGRATRSSCRPTPSSPPTTSSCSTTPCRSSWTRTWRRFQIDADKIEAAITEQHHGASCPSTSAATPADLDTILEVAEKHKMPVVEDACQAHLAEWRGRKVGTWGTHRLLQLPGEQEPQLRRRRRDAHQRRPSSPSKCYAFHNNCRAPQGHRLQLHLHPARAAPTSA